MGFSGLATTIIMFIAVMLLATGVIVTLNQNIQDTQSGMRSQAELLQNQLHTNIDITQTNYTAGNVRLYVMNNGKTILKLDRIDVYLDDEFIPRNDTNRTIALEASTDTKNPGLWDPNEVIRIDVSKSISAGSHRVAVSTQYGVKDEEDFSV